MATLVLGAVGTALGAGFGGTIMGLSGAVIGGAIGSGVGSVVDAWIVQSFTPNQNYEGDRLESLKVTTSTEGGFIPQVLGRQRVGGNVIWATDFREDITRSTQGSGKGGGGNVTTTSYNYYASFAVAICEGPISGIGRIWADGDLMDLKNATYRVYLGDEEQDPDPYIVSVMGAAPAYRGTVYIVFEDLFLEDYGNRLPQINVEVLRSIDGVDGLEGLVRSVTLIPSTGEFSYSTEIVTKGDKGATEAENANNDKAQSDLMASLDQLQNSAPAIENVSLVVSWFGLDLRCGNCDVVPGVELAEKDTSATWSVDGISRTDAHVVTSVGGAPQLGGTPSDFSIVQSIREIKERGLTVTFYPFILMDVNADNTLPDPYSDNAANIGQAVFPWRGRVTCSPAAGYAGTVDNTAAATTQVSNFFGSAAAADFETHTDASTGHVTVSYIGTPGDFGYRRMVLHNAHLCHAAGGVDAFLIGSELVGLTTIRGAGNSYPAVSQLQSLAAEVRSILGGSTKIGYGADWTEYSGHRPADGSGSLYFHLDPLWADSSIDFVGIDNYFPLADWRDGFDHIDAATTLTTYDREYLQGNVEGGEGFDWYYASESDRAVQNRLPITDGAYGKPWVYRYKDVRSWWSNRHYNRPGGVESGSATGWVPQSKPIWFTEIGCPAVDRGANQPNVFYDPKSSESAVPYFSRAWRDDKMQRAFLEAALSYWGDNSNNPISNVYGGRMIDVGNAAVWTWDARPYPYFPLLSDVWGDGDNWQLGHWLTGRLGSAGLRNVVTFLCRSGGMADEDFDVSDLRGAVEGIVITSLQSPRSSIASLAKQFGFDATETEGRIVFRMRGAASVASIGLDDLVSTSDGEVIEFERAQETELPHALKWQVSCSGDDYDSVQVEARRSTVNSNRITTDSFAFAMPPEEAERNARRALQEAWVGRETASFSLPPSMLALDATDVIALAHDGRIYDLRATQINDGESRTVTAMLQDREVYDLPPGRPRTRGSSAIGRQVIFGEPIFEFLDLPQIVQAESPHQPLMAAWGKPWPGTIGVWRSPAESGFTLLTSFDSPAQIGVTLEPFASGPTSRWDLGNTLEVKMSSGTIESVSDLDLFNGANMFAVETSDGAWELVQAAEAVLVGASAYRLTRLLRGQSGTEAQMVASVPAGARVIAITANLASAPIGTADVGVPWYWTITSGSSALTDTNSIQLEFTPSGRGLQPFSPVLVDQPWRTSRAVGNLDISWVRRSRDLSADSWVVSEVPLGEDSELYEVDILDGAFVKRTLSTTSTSVIYTSDHQVVDFGAALGPGSMLDIQIAQVSTAYGRGAAHQVTLIF